MFGSRGGNAIMQIRLYRNLWIWNINIAPENRFGVFEQQETWKYIHRLSRITRINSHSPFGSSINYPLWRTFSMIRTPKSLLGHRFHTMVVILAIWVSLYFYHIFFVDRYSSGGFYVSLKITIRWWEFDLFLLLLTNDYGLIWYEYWKGNCLTN